MTKEAFNPFEQWDAAKTQFYVTEPVEEKVADGSLTEAEATESETPSPVDSTPVDTSNENPTPDSSLSDKQIDWEKRYRDLQSFKDKKIKELEKTLKETSKKSIEIPKTAEELQAFKESNKDAYDIMMSMVRLEVMERDKELKEQFEELKKHQESLSKQKAIAEFNKIHPDIDLEKLPTDPKFKAWFTTKSARLQQEIQTSDDPHYFADIISLYKKETGIEVKAKDTAKDKLEATKTIKVSSNSAPTSDGKKQWKMSEVKKLSPVQYEKLEPEIDTAIREGRFDFNS